MTYEEAYAIWNGDTKATADEYMEMTKLVSKAILKQKLIEEGKICPMCTDCPHDCPLERGDNE